MSDADDERRWQRWERSFSKLSVTNRNNIAQRFKFEPPSSNELLLHKLFEIGELTDENDVVKVKEIFRRAGCPGHYVAPAASQATQEEPNATEVASGERSPRRSPRKTSASSPPTRQDSPRRALSSHAVCSALSVPLLIAFSCAGTGDDDGRSRQPKRPSTVAETRPVKKAKPNDVRFSVYSRTTRPSIAFFSGEGCPKSSSQSSILLGAKQGISCYTGLLVRDNIYNKISPFPRVSLFLLSPRKIDVTDTYRSLFQQLLNDTCFPDYIGEGSDSHGLRHKGHFVSHFSR